MNKQTEASSSPVVVEDRSSIRIVRLNRPAERNSLSIATLEELESIVSSSMILPHIAAIIFTGTDDVFASGADIRELQQLTRSSALEFSERGQRLFQKIADAPQLTVAAVNGYCMGGGLDFALACDIRCASVSAVFAHPGARLGIITGWGGTQRLPKLIGTARAFEMFTTARRVSSQEAHDIGLVNRIGDPVLACALEIAHNAIPSGMKKGFRV